MLRKNWKLQDNITLGENGGPYPPRVDKMRSWWDSGRERALISRLDLSQRGEERARRRGRRASGPFSESSPETWTGDAGPTPPWTPSLCTPTWRERQLSAGALPTSCVALRLRYYCSNRPILTIHDAKRPLPSSST